MDGMVPQFGRWGFAIEHLYAVPFPCGCLCVYRQENVVQGGDAVVDVDPGIEAAAVTFHGDDGGGENKYGKGEEPEEPWHDEDNYEEQDIRLAD